MTWWSKEKSIYINPIDDGLSEVDEETNTYGQLILINEEMVGRVNLQNSNTISVLFMHSGRNNGYSTASISLFRNTE